LIGKASQVWNQRFERVSGIIPFGLAAVWLPKDGDGWPVSDLCEEPGLQPTVFFPQRSGRR
jgi:hypothetical protein